MSKRRVEAICAAAEGSTTNMFPMSPPTRPIQAIRPEDVPRPNLKAKSKPCERADARLKHLDSLHAQTQVQESLRLPSGRRIKLADHSGKQTGLDNEATTRNSSIEIYPESSLVLLEETHPGYSDDDLPEPSELLDSHCRQNASSDPSSAKYSDPEVDVLIQCVQESERAQTERPCNPVEDGADWLRDALGDDVDFDHYSASDKPTDHFSSPGSHGMKRKVGLNSPASQRKKSKTALSSAEVASHGSPPLRKEKVRLHVHIIHILLRTRIPT